MHFVDNSTFPLTKYWSNGCQIYHCTVKIFDTSIYSTQVLVWEYKVLWISKIEPLPFADCVADVIFCLKCSICLTECVSH